MSSYRQCSRAVGIISFAFVSCSILVSLTSVMVLLTSFILYGVKIDVLMLVAAFVLTFSVYNLDRVIVHKEDLMNEPKRSNSFAHNRRMFRTVLLFSFALFVLLGACEGLGALLTLLLPLIGYAAYDLSLPFLPRLKEIPVVKNAVLVGTWAAVPVLLPTLRVLEPIGEKTLVLSILIFYFIFTKIMVNSILFDFRDVNGDSASGVRTVPIILGRKGVRRLLFILNSWLFLWITTCLLVGSFIEYLPILGVNALYGFGYIHFLTKRPIRRRILVDLLVDGEWIPLALVIALMNMPSWAF